MADHPIRAVHSGDVSVGWIPVTGTWARPCCPALSTDCLPVRCGDQFRRLATGTVGEAIPYGTDAGTPPTRMPIPPRPLGRPHESVQFSVVRNVQFSVAIDRKPCDA